MKNSAEVYGAEGRTNLFQFDPEKLILVTDKKHTLYDPRIEEPVSEELVKSIMWRGVLEPIIVWRDPENPEGGALVVDGRQRVKAAREANHRLAEQGSPPKLIRAVVERGDAKSMLALVAMSNEGRLAPTPVGRAKLVRRLLDAGYAEPAIAIILHVSEDVVSRAIELSDTPQDVQNAVESGNISATDAPVIAGLPRADREKLMAEIASDPKKRTRKASIRRATGEVKPRSAARIIALRNLLIVQGDDPDNQEEQANWVSAFSWVLGISDYDCHNETQEERDTQAAKDKKAADKIANKKLRAELGLPARGRLPNKKVA